MLKTIPAGWGDVCYHKGEVIPYEFSHLPYHGDINLCGGQGGPYTKIPCDAFEILPNKKWYQK